MSMGALAVMIIGSLPPASITAGFIKAAAAIATARPAATDPVKATAWVWSLSTSARPRSAPPGRQAIRPSGRPRNTRQKSKVHSVVASAGLMMQPFPAASDAATVQHISRMGKLKGMICTDTPKGS